MHISEGEAVGFHGRYAIELRDQAVTEEPKCVDREIDGHNTVVSWRLQGGGQCSDTRRQGSY